MVKEVKKPKSKLSRTTRQRNDSFSFAEFLYKTISVVAAVALIISYISTFVNPERHWVPMFFGLYFIPIAFFNILLLLIGLFRRRSSLLIPLMALIPALFLADKYVKIGSEERTLTGDNIKVVSYNLGRFEAGRRGMTTSESLSGVRKFLKEQDADIVCLQELHLPDPESIKQYFPEYPYFSQYLKEGPGFFGNVILSRFPVLESEKISFPETANLCLRSDIQLDGSVLRVFNCHLESNAISFTSIVKRLTNKEQFKDEIVEVHGKLRSKARKRAEQVKTICSMDEESPYPSMICGDFNDLPTSYTYHMLSSGKKDTFCEGGKGFSATYSKLWPLLRIDYVLIPEEFDADCHKVHRIGYSDHYPVTTYIYY